MVCEYLSKAQIKGNIYPLIKKMEIGNGGNEWENRDYIVYHLKPFRFNIQYKVFLF